ncbi:Msr family ABC-F type ribosomal protection protein [Ornithinibacillus californiensis]|uniref:Msr family ABC-F type ribosomal protection protein n=1 Tax=Ornithinibacillus californiensis TaxID=161536 RepID=UPI00064D7318|nr:ABC-F type ribosomal protection protein [Ornithinibacillus californiensis]
MENILFELENVIIRVLEKEILKIDRLAVHQFDRIGIVGRNGAGKSTLLKLLAGKRQPTVGRISRLVEPSYFDQLAKYNETSEADGALTSKLGVSQVTNHPSGGEETRLKLAQLFTTYREAILMDEPTTHLDKTGKDFLVNQLTYYYGALVIVSHDRSLLDDLVTTIWEVVDGKVTVYKGNYSAYAATKQVEVEQKRLAYDSYVKEKERLEKAATEKMAKAQKILASSKAKQKGKEKPSRLGKTKSKGTSQKGMHRVAKSIEQRIQNLPEVTPIKNEGKITFLQSDTVALHNKFPIMADNLTIEVPQCILLEQVSFQMPLGKKIAITGPNGAGKSTLLHYLITGKEGLTLSPKAKIGSFLQKSYRFETDETVLSFLRNRTDQNEGVLRSVLNRMQFAGTDLQKEVCSLSGGEAVRLQLCLLFLGKYNILILDEPTNFLDIDALEALEQFIEGYKGTIIIVSHDKTFINEVSDIEYEIDPVSKSINQVR